MEARPDARLVSVFKTDDPGVLPLAKMALESEGIEYFAHSAGKADSLEWTMSQTPTIRPVVVEILVTADVASRARELLADLEAQAAAAGSLPAAESVVAPDPPTVTLEDAVTGSTIGTITESQLQDITSRLEEEAEEAPQQYRLSDSTLDELQKDGLDATLIALLRAAVRPDGDTIVRWVVK